MKWKIPLRLSKVRFTQWRGRAGIEHCATVRCRCKQLMTFEFARQKSEQYKIKCNFKVYNIYRLNGPSSWIVWTQTSTLIACLMLENRLQTWKLQSNQKQTVTIQEAMLRRWEINISQDARSRQMTLKMLLWILTRILKFIAGEVGLIWQQYAIHKWILDL